MKRSSCKLVLFKLISIACFCQGFPARCGIAKKAGGLISGGQGASERNQFPWLVALVDKTNQNHFCAGNLVSEKHVLTAAHCIQNKHEIAPLGAGKFSAHVGRYDLSDDDEIFASNKIDVNRTFIHPDWKVNELSYDGDIAMLLLQMRVMFSMNVQPACLPSIETAVDKGIAVS